ncbi:hypothetical protein [uncultured Variovorax sp.]|nr:hypothetical protein [uncultured Variovorax sp.]
MNPTLRALIEAIALVARFNSDARALHASRAPTTQASSPKGGAA